MAERIVPCVYFDETGPTNTAATLRLALERAKDLGVRTVLVASTTGATGVEAAQVFFGYNLVVITHSHGFQAPDTQQFLPEHRQAIEAAGATILTCQHTFGGVGRAVRRKLGTYELEEIIAYTLRLFGQGMKVVCEIALMAADAGLINTEEDAIAIGGSGQGADTAVILRPANAMRFFDLKVREILCKPRDF